MSTTDPDDDPVRPFDPETAHALAARGDALVRVRLRSGPCWCRLLEALPARARRPTRFVVDVAGVRHAVALADIVGCMP